MTPSIAARACRNLCGFLVVLVAVSAGAQQPKLRTFLPTDMEPLGVVLDAARNQLFVSIAELNRIDVFSLTTHELIDRIAIPSPSGMDLTLDGSRLIVGSGGKYNLYQAAGTQFLSVIDPATHRIVKRYPVPNANAPLSFLTIFPHLLVCLEGDLVVTMLGTYDSDYTAFLKLDLNTGVFSPLHPPGGFGVFWLQRVGRSSTILLSDNSTGVALYDVATDQVVAQTSGYYVYAGVTASSPDGNRIVLSTPDCTSLRILDGQLRELATAASNIYDL